DTATLTAATATGTDIQVAASGFTTQTFNNVTGITASDGGTNASQSIALTSTGTNKIGLTGAISLTGIETVTLSTSTTLQASTFGESGATSGVQLNTAGVTTTGGQTYNDAVTVGINTALNAGTATVAFGSTVDSAGTGPFDLNVATSGTTTFGGAVGNIKL